MEQIETGIFPSIFNPSYGWPPPPPPPRRSMLGGRWGSPCLDAEEEFRVACFVGGEQMEDLIIYIAMISPKRYPLHGFSATNRRLRENSVSILHSRKSAAEIPLSRSPAPAVGMRPITPAHPIPETKVRV